VVVDAGAGVVVDAGAGVVVVVDAGVVLVIVPTIFIGPELITLLL